MYVAEISSALAFLHEKKIVHRDIKPDNILLDERGHAHVTDFNVAVHHPEDRLLTSVAGSKAYIGAVMDSIMCDILQLTPKWWISPT